MTTLKVEKQFRPEQIFGPDPERVEGVYRQLVRRFHPDRPGGDAQIMAVINDLHDKARDLIRLEMYG